MIKLTATINGKQVLEIGLLNFVESRLIHPLKEGDQVTFTMEETDPNAPPIKFSSTEVKHFKVNPKG